MKWKEMARPDLDKVDREATVVVAPFGSVEQHSLHLPVFTDSIIVEAIADRLDAKLGGDVLILPVQWLGLSPHHLDFGGTLSAGIDTHVEMAYDIGTSALGNGFLKLLMLNGHGGNAATLEVAMCKLAIDHPEASVVCTSYWKVAAREIDEIRASPIGGIGHACEMETSMIMALRPELVHTDRLKPDGLPRESQFLWKDITRGGTVSKYEPFTLITKNGGFGDPTLATAEKGERFLDAAVDGVAKVINEMKKGIL